MPAAARAAAIGCGVDIVGVRVLGVHAEYHARWRPAAKGVALTAANDAAAVLMAAQIGDVAAGIGVVSGDILAVETAAADVEQRLVEKGPRLTVG